MSENLGITPEDLEVEEIIGLTSDGEEELSNGYDPEFDKLEAHKIFKED